MVRRRCRIPSKFRVSSSNVVVGGPVRMERAAAKNTKRQTAEKHQEYQEYQEYQALYSVAKPAAVVEISFARSSAKTNAFCRSCLVVNFKMPSSDN